MPDWEESALLPGCTSVGRAAVAINVYGLLSDHSSYTQLAGALCHLGLFAILATHHLVVLLGAVPQASCFQGTGTLGGRCDTPTHLSVQPHGTLQPISTGGETLVSEKADGPGKGVPQGSHPGQRPFLVGAMGLSLRTVLEQHRVGGKQSLTFAV